MTDFEGFTHQQMRDMIASLDPASVQTRADQLAAAAAKINAIGDALKRHVVTGWEGEGADAFQLWVGRAGNATLRLGEYSAKGGEWMGKVVQTMTEATKMVAVDKTATKNLEAALNHPNDPDASTVRAEAQSMLDADHREAVRLMTNLAQSYQLSSTEMDKATIPTFPPPPGELVPKVSYGDQDMARPGGESGGGGGSTGSSYTTTGASHSTSSSDPGSVTGRSLQPDNTVPSASVPSIPDREVDVDLDSVAVLPDRTVPPVTTTPGPLPTGPVSPTPGPVLPPMGFPPVGGMKPPSLTGPGIGPYPGLGGPGTPPPGGKPLGTPGMLPRDSGITGGKPVTSTGPSSGIPRGNVIGEGTHMRPGHGWRHGSRLRRWPRRPERLRGRSSTRLGAGRHRRREAGYGSSADRGRPAVHPGRLGPRAQRRWCHGARGCTGADPGQAAGRPGGERADYLAEDEETWQANRRVVPPVID